MGVRLLQQPLRSLPSRYPAPGPTGLSRRLVDRRGSSFVSIEGKCKAVVKRLPKCHSVFFSSRELVQHILWRHIAKYVKISPGILSWVTRGRIFLLNSAQIFIWFHASCEKKCFLFGVMLRVKESDFYLVSCFVWNLKKRNFRSVLSYQIVKSCARILRACSKINFFPNQISHMTFYRSGPVLPEQVVQ